MTVQHVTAEDMQNMDIAQRVEQFNQCLSQHLDETNFVIEDQQRPPVIYIEYDDEGAIIPNDDGETRPEADEVDSYDKWIGATFLLDPIQNGDNVGTKARVMQCRTDPFGNPIGRAHSNPLMDTREYDVLLEDGTYNVYCANTIAENLWSQCDSEGREVQRFKEIIDHKSDGNAVTIDNGYDIVNGSGTNRVCSSKQDTGGTSFQMVGAIRAQKARSDHKEAQIEILVNHPQVWDPHTKDNRGSNEA
jgi:hypothetical protein